MHFFFFGSLPRKTADHFKDEFHCVLFSSLWSVLTIGFFFIVHFASRKEKKGSKMFEFTPSDVSTKLHVTSAFFLKHLCKIKKILELFFYKKLYQFLIIVKCILLVNVITRTNNDCCKRLKYFVFIMKFVLCKVNFLFSKCSKRQ